MAYFAKINELNVVTEVLSVPDEQENRAREYLSFNLGLGGTWIQTSFNGRIRKQFAGVGYTYDETNDVFIEPKPFESWTLDEDFEWQPPVDLTQEQLDSDNFYQWNETAYQEDNTTGWEIRE